MNLFEARKGRCVEVLMECYPLRGENAAWRSGVVVSRSFSRASVCVELEGGLVLRVTVPCEKDFQLSKVRVRAERLDVDKMRT